MSSDEFRPEPEFEKLPLEEMVSEPDSGPQEPISNELPPNEGYEGQAIESGEPTPPANINDEVEPARSAGSWLHPTSIMFDIISSARQNLFPAVIALFGATQWGVTGVVLAAVIFGGSLMFSVFRYLTLRYEIRNGELTVREGLLFKRVRTVPLERIQNIDSTQNILHRMLKVAEVRVETAAGKEPEAKLRVLSIEQIAKLRESVFSYRSEAPAQPSVSDGEERSPAAPPVPVESTSLHTITIEQLVKAGIASNRGVLVFGVLAGAYFQFDLYEKFRLDRLFDLVPKDMGLWNSVFALAGGLLFLFVATRVYGAIWYLLRFSGYQLTRQNDDFRIRCGLLTKVTATVPQRRIQFISVHQSLIMRLFGLASIRIETAGGSTQETEDATSSVGRRWFIPVIRQEKVNSILSHLRPGLEWNPDNVEWSGVSKNTAKRLYRIAVMVSLLVAVSGLAINRPWGWIAGAVVLPVLIYSAYRASRAMRYAETDFGVVYRSGFLTKKLSMTFFDRIQTLRFDQSPFDRRWKMATLSVDTAAAGPAEHRIEVKYLDEAFARKCYEQLSKRLATQFG